MIGLAIMAIGLLALSQIDRDTSQSTAAALLAFFGLGFGLVSQVLTVAIQNAVDRRDLGIATASANLFRSLGGAIGAAAFGAIFGGDIDALPTVFLVAAPVAIARPARRPAARRGPAARPATGAATARCHLVLERSLDMPSVPNLTTKVLLRSEESGGHVSVIENVLPPHFSGPHLHTHDFDEAFYVLEGELIFQVEDALVTKRAGEFAFAPRNVPHTLANHSDAPARYVLVCTPAGFERYFARIAAERGRRAAGVGAAADPRGHARRAADSVGRMSARRAIFIAPFDELSEPGMRRRARRARRGARLGRVLRLGPHRLPRAGHGARRSVDHAGRDRRPAPRSS